MHDKLNLNLVYALSTRSLCQTKITQDAITTRAYRRVEVKFIAILLEFLFFFSMYAKRLWCMQIDQDRVGETTSMYANRLVCETTGFRRIMQILTRYSVKTHRNLALSCIHLSYSTSKFLYLFDLKLVWLLIERLAYNLWIILNSWNFREIICLHHGRYDAYRSILNSPSLR